MLLFNSSRLSSVSFASSVRQRRVVSLFHLETRPCIPSAHVRIGAHISSHAFICASCSVKCQDGGKYILVSDAVMWFVDDGIQECMKYEIR